MQLKNHGNILFTKDGKSTKENNMSVDIFKESASQKFLIQFESFLTKHLKSFQALPFKGHKQLKSAIEYSLFSGGKRFRPLLIFATAQLLKINSNITIPWAAVIEMIHTASLIHDDLPCMDNSPQRRNKASCHRRFGEDMALLAGDCLWIEAFRLIQLSGRTNKTKAHWSGLLCEAAGLKGLMGGQALDLKAPAKPNKSYYNKMHFMKTGALIAAGMEGVLLLKGKATEKIQRIKKAGLLIGRAFQLSDDLQDSTEKNASNFSHILGRKEAQKQLNKLSAQATQLIDFNDSSSCFLKRLIAFNQNRAFN